MRPLIIAIDGPSGAGKGTVARAVASELGYRHIDSGAMYRAVGWKAIKSGQDFDEDAVARLAEHSAIEVTPIRVAIDGEDVTRAIRTPEIIGLDLLEGFVFLGAQIPVYRHVCLSAEPLDSFKSLLKRAVNRL